MVVTKHRINTVIEMMYKVKLVQKGRGLLHTNNTCITGIYQVFQEVRSVV